MPDVLYQLKVKEIFIKDFGKIDAKEVNASMNFSLIFPLKVTDRTRIQSKEETIKIGERKSITYHSEANILEKVNSLKELKNQLNGLSTPATPDSTPDVPDAIREKFIDLIGNEAREALDELAGLSNTDANSWKEAADSKRLSQIIEFHELEKFIRKIRLGDFTTEERFREARKNLIKTQEYNLMKTMTDLELLNLAELPLEELSYVLNLNEDAYLKVLIVPKEDADAKENKKKKSEKAFLTEAINVLTGMLPVPGLAFLLRDAFASATLGSTEVSPAQGIIKIKLADLATGNDITIPLYATNDCKENISSAKSTRLSDKIFFGESTFLDRGENTGEIVFEVQRN